MKSIYQCEKCGGIFSEQWAVEECENKHAMPIKLLSATHRGHRSAPMTVTVRLSDGTLAVYGYLDDETKNQTILSKIRRDGVAIGLVGIKDMDTEEQTIWDQACRNNRESAEARKQAIENHA